MNANYLTFKAKYNIEGAAVV